jgi:hypothetical protein
MFQSTRFREEEDEDYCTTRCFLNFAENKVYKMKYVFEGFGYDPWCVGSSHGWLVILDDVCGVSRKTFILKAVLLADPSRSDNFGVVLIYNGPLLPSLAESCDQLAFYKHGDRTWTNLVSLRGRDYCDIIGHDNQLYALTNDDSSESLELEVWDFRSPFPKIMSTIAPFTRLKGIRDIDKYLIKFYLVKTSSDFLLIQRFYLDYDYEKGLVDDDDVPFETKLFNVYKLDFRQKVWKRVKSLNDQVVFLGKNQSMSLFRHDWSECIPNSVYFTDDHSEDEFLCESYVGRDIGLFNIDDESIMSFYDIFDNLDSWTINPPPLWITPNPW